MKIHGSHFQEKPHVSQQCNLIKANIISKISKFVLVIVLASFFYIVHPSSLGSHLVGLHIVVVSALSLWTLPWVRLSGLVGLWRTSL